MLLIYLILQLTIELKLNHVCVCIHIFTLLGAHVYFSWKNTSYLPNFTVEHSSEIQLFVCVYIFLLCSALTCTFCRESALYVPNFSVDYSSEIESFVCVYTTRYSAQR